MTAGMVRACYRRLNLLNSEQLLRNIAEHSVEEAKTNLSLRDYEG